MTRSSLRLSFYNHARTALLLLVLPASLAAQTIVGVVRTRESAMPLEGAEVRVVAIDGTEYLPTQSDMEGRFSLNVSGGGRYALWVRLVGYRASLTVLHLAASDTAVVAVAMEAHLVELEGVTVYGLSVETDGQREFWSRRHLPWNISLDYREIEQLHVGTLPEVLSVLPFKTRCKPPLVYVDGWKRPSYYLGNNPLDWVYGVEVYRDQYDIPIRYRDGTDPRVKCGAVLVWTTALGQRR